MCGSQLRRQHPESFVEAVAGGAILLVDKARGWTSHDVVARTRRVMGTRKVGHAGTLDPMATGLLTLGVGSATRLLTHMVGLDKVYTATIRLGQATVSDDAEGNVTAVADADLVHEFFANAQSRLAAAAERLTGDIMQTPTAVSAIKVAGKRAYELVRAGADPQLQQRAVTVHSFELGTPELVTSGAVTVVDVRCRVRVSSGTYVRALARDLGNILGVYGHLTELRRESVGPFSVTEALPLQTLEQQAAAVTACGTADFTVVRPLTAAAAAVRLFPAVMVTADQEIALGHGKQLPTEFPDTEIAAAVGEHDRLAALVRVSGGSIRVVTGFPRH